MTRRKYTGEFKVSAVRLVNEQGYSAGEAARLLGDAVLGETVSDTG